MIESVVPLGYFALQVFCVTVLVKASIDA